jgi:hypothetical protein
MAEAQLTQWDVVELLKSLQGDRTNVEFALLLGVHNSYLSKVYAGEIPVGKKLVQGLIRLCPEMRIALALFLAGDLQDSRMN